MTSYPGQRTAVLDGNHMVGLLYARIWSPYITARFLYCIITLPSRALLVTFPKIYTTVYLVLEEDLDG